MVTETWSDEAEERFEFEDESDDEPSNKSITNNGNKRHHGAEQGKGGLQNQNESSCNESDEQKENESHTGGSTDHFFCGADGSGPGTGVAIVINQRIKKCG